MKQLGNHVYMSAREAANTIGVTMRTIHKWSLPVGQRPRKAPDIKPFRDKSGQLLYRYDVVMSIRNSQFNVSSLPQLEREEDLIPV